MNPMVGARFKRAPTIGSFGITMISIYPLTSSISIAQIGKILVDILPQLQRLHQQGQLHGQINPAHVIWQATESLYQLAPSNDSLPDPVYSAPEQLRGQPCAASDLYSLGVTCIHLLTGIHPFELFDVAANQWIWRDYWLAAGDQQLAVVLDRLIQPDLDQRFSSASMALAAIQKIMGKTIQATSQWHCLKSLVGHHGLFAGVTSLALNHHILATASEDKTIRLWDLPTGQILNVLSGHQGFVETVAFQPHHNQILASGSRDKTVKIWDHERLINTLVSHTQSVNALAFSSDGQQLASGSSDRTIKLWSMPNGELITTLTGHKMKVNAVAFRHNGQLASASADSTINIWQNHDIQQQLTGHIGAVQTIAFSPNGRWLASGGEDRLIRLWDTQTWQCAQIFPGHAWQVSALAFTPNSDVLLSGSWDKTVKLWHISTGQEFDSLSGHNDSVTCVAIDPIGQQIFTGSRDRLIKIWQLI
jgi:serine/threonine protein kinase